MNTSEKLHLFHPVNEVMEMLVKAINKVLKKMAPNQRDFKLNEKSCTIARMNKIVEKYDIDCLALTQSNIAHPAASRSLI